MTDTVKFDPRNGALWRVSPSGRRTPLGLEPGEFDLLTYLLSKRGRCVPLAELQEALWRGMREPDYSDKIVHIRIHRLRRKLAGTDIRIDTRHTFGYRAVRHDAPPLPARDAGEPPAAIIVHRHDSGRRYAIPPGRAQRHRAGRRPIRWVNFSQQQEAQV